MCVCKHLHIYTCVQVSPAPWGLWLVIGSHPTGHRGQELLPLLLHLAGSTDDLMAGCAEVRPVDFLRKILRHHLQVSLRRRDDRLFKRQMSSIGYLSTLHGTHLHKLEDLLLSAFGFQEEAIGVRALEDAASFEEFQHSVLNKGCVWRPSVS